MLWPTVSIDIWRPKTRGTGRRFAARAGTYLSDRRRILRFAHEFDRGRGTGSYDVTTTTCSSELCETGVWATIVRATVPSRSTTTTLSLFRIGLSCVEETRRETFRADANVPTRLVKRIEFNTVTTVTYAFRLSVRRLTVVELNGVIFNLWKREGKYSSNMIRIYYRLVCCLRR